MLRSRANSVKAAACSTSPLRAPPRAKTRPAAPRPAGASGRPRSRRAAGPHRPADQQGHRAQSAGALAIHRRRAGGRAPRVPVHQRHRLQGQALRHAGGGRRAGVVAGDLRHGHGPAGRARSATPGCARSPIRSRRSRSTTRRARRWSSPAMRCAPKGSRRCRCRCRRRASTPRPISPRRCASPRIPRAACATWAPIAPR